MAPHLTTCDLRLAVTCTLSAVSRPMSIPSVCCWTGGLNDHGLAQGVGHMVIYSPTTGDIIAVDQCTMENGMTKSSAPVDLSTNDVVYPDVTTTVAQLVDDDWLFEEDVSCSKTMAVKAKKAKVKKYFSEHCVA